MELTREICKQRSKTSSMVEAFANASMEAISEILAISWAQFFCIKVHVQNM